MEDLLGYLNIEGLTVRYVGGMRVLLTFPSCRNAKKILQNEKELWMTWFHTLDVWEGQSFKFERVVWLKIMGVPIHLWDKEVFDKIAEHFGPIVHGSLASVNDGNLAHDSVVVIWEDGWKVAEKIEVQWRRESFQVWVTESETDWDPDFVLLKPVRTSPAKDVLRPIVIEDEVPAQVNHDKHEKEKTIGVHMKVGDIAVNNNPVVTGYPPENMIGEDQSAQLDLKGQGNKEFFGESPPRE
ncbi:hypothetical protein HanIR_Chr15g0757951 [Helianthus annuus]|nr:hypothetical protein HanIR_Chr15g0757951 [Helianthus annuus]